MRDERSLLQAGALELLVGALQEVEQLRRALLAIELEVVEVEGLLLRLLVARARCPGRGLVALGVAQRGLKDFAAAKTTWDRVIREAPRRSAPRADAMFDVAILQLDYMNDPVEGKAALERYLQEASVSHAKRQAAEEKRKELGK